jgi:hypothetical protein
MPANDAAAIRALVSRLGDIGKQATRSRSNGKQTSAGSATIKQADLKGLGDVVSELAGKDVLIGIPRENAARGDGESLNNAARAYILDRGSPAANIPARPFLEPGVKAALPRAEKYLMQGVKKAIKGDAQAIDRGLTAAGVSAESEVKKKIRSNLPPPLSVFTVMWRHHDRGGKMRDTEKAYVGLVGIGYTPAQAQAATGIKSLINTGEMLRSITHIVRSR